MENKDSRKKEEMNRFIHEMDAMDNEIEAQGYESGYEAGYDKGFDVCEKANEKAYKKAYKKGFKEGYVKGFENEQQKDTEWTLVLN